MSRNIYNNSNNNSVDFASTIDSGVYNSGPVFNRGSNVGKTEATTGGAYKETEVDLGVFGKRGEADTMPENFDFSDETQIETEVSKDGVQESYHRTVGWMVGVKGDCCYGKDFHLHNGHNFIGRSEEFSVNLTDKHVSSKPVADIIYDPKHRAFVIAPQAGSEKNLLCYVNDSMLLLPVQLKPYDRIQLAATKFEIELIFVPLCSEQFQWEDED